VRPAAAAKSQTIVSAPIAVAVSNDSCGATRSQRLARPVVTSVAVPLKITAATRRPAAMWSEGLSNSRLGPMVSRDREVLALAEIAAGLFASRELEVRHVDVDHAVHQLKAVGAVV
jgi:hypothetical protein